LAVDGGWREGAWQFTTLMIMSLILFTPEAELQLRMRSPGSATVRRPARLETPAGLDFHGRPPMETQP
ncbi:hypothetical protein C0050_19605, partial [Pseudomonas aeruginosa]